LPYETDLKNDGLLDGEALRLKLEEILPTAQSDVSFISAYVTQSGVEWFCKHASAGAKRQIICRLLPMDVINGSTHLSALQTAIDNGIEVLCLHSLHAKIYSIDNKKIFIGSANLTNNGLMIYGTGNLEACAQITPDQTTIDFLKHISSLATEIDSDALKRMQGCIDLKESEVFLDKWPTGILQEQEGIWVRDFFWSNPQDDAQSKENIHDAEILGIQGNTVTEGEIKQHLLKTRCVKWLIEKLQKSPDQVLYFGNLTQKLHEDLQDDPTPYRKDVKSLLQNLLSYCAAYLEDEIEISRPNHSQKIKLLSKSLS
tara:strand:- start:1912 stop:2853 length:942 start_codon:yes stop_codon:yes gene_type:complete